MFHDDLRRAVQEAFKLSDEQMATIRTAPGSYVSLAEFRDQLLGPAIEQTAAELEAKIRSQIPRGARVAYEAHEVPGSFAWWTRGEYPRPNVVDGECEDVTGQSALPAPGRPMSSESDGEQPEPTSR